LTQTAGGKVKYIPRSVRIELILKGFQLACFVAKPILLCNG
jgi:hypothetical protein